MPLIPEPPAATEPASQWVRLPKKLIICCDGTWMDRDNGIEAASWGKPGEIQHPSNVTRIARAVKPDDQAGHPQITYYQAGIGTGIGLYSELMGGGTGLGLSEHVREAYSFLASNYSPEDHLSKPDSIFLLGFSRGAFTARTLGGFIASVGILTPRALPWFYDCFKDWENAGIDGYEPQFFKAYAKANPEEDVIKDMPRLRSPSKPDEIAIDTYLKAYRKHLLAFGLTQEVSIKCIGVWDTVGALGIPVTPFLQRVFAMAPFIREYRWFDTRLSDVVENAFQALALDERRSPFSPSVWELDPGGKTNLKQVWFPGAHGNCGGGYEDEGMANITLAWMMDQLAGNNADPLDWDPVDWIAFDDRCIEIAYRHNNEFYQHVQDAAHKGWARGKVFESVYLPMSLAGAITRTPGRYRRTDYASGAYTNEALRRTYEMIHSSVRTRIGFGGREVESTAFYQKVLRGIWRLLTFQRLVQPYNPQRRQSWWPASGGPLEDWKLNDNHAPYSEPDVQISMSSGTVNSIHWEYQGKDRVCSKVMKEEVFAQGGFEERLLAKDPEIEEHYSHDGLHPFFQKPKKPSTISRTF